MHKAQTNNNEFYFGCTNDGLLLLFYDQLHKVS